MPSVRFDQMPRHSRLWTFAASRPVQEGEKQEILRAVDEFLAQWTAHGVPLTSARDWRYDRFLFVAVDEAAADVSGCSIDALVRSLRELERQFDLSLTDNGPVFFRAGDSIRRVTRSEFKRLAETEAVDSDTVVFDNTIQTVGALRDGQWETPASRSWHRVAFFAQQSLG